MIFEICTDSVEGVIAAGNGGAQRVELCDNLVEGGTTPSYGMIRTACQVARVQVNVIIRPRGGDFCYSDYEFEVMRQDILNCKALGVNGVVFGILKPDGKIDLERTQALVNLARPMSVTFHRAFDLCIDPVTALEDLIKSGVDRLLTSGQQADVLQGAACIKTLVQQAGERFVIMAGGGVNAETLPEIVSITGVKEVHFAARIEKQSPMQFKNQHVFMGKAYQPNEYIQKETDAEKIRKVIASLP
ncbi:MAG: copper homeostasis protein CutC [Anaerolineae bacterium]|nr:copper homeostasis protein CutC [Anaerolineae bacterium]